MRKCVIFDLDGTLTRSEEGIWNCVRYAAEKLGFPVPDAATLRKFIGPPLGWSFMEYMGMSEEMANKAVSTYRERYEAVGLFENRVYPGIRRLLRMLHRDGWYIGIATGKPQHSSERIIEHFGLNRYITKIVGPKDGRGADKELLIRQALPEDAGEAWMVGDRRFDMEGAKKVGIGAIGAGYGYGSREELMNSGCDVYCETVEDIIRHLCPGEEAVPGAFLSIEGMDGSGKTTQMAALSGGKALITACEKNAIRADRLQFNLTRQGARAVNIMRQDARLLDSLFKFDKILLDAPCSGSGTLLLEDGEPQRRMTADWLAKTAKTQKVLLQKALSLLPKKHEMVYSTCSVLQMENEDIVQSAVSMGICEVVPIEHPFLTDVPLLPTKVDGVVCVKPDERFEGFFVAKLRRK